MNVKSSKCVMASFFPCLPSQRRTVALYGGFNFNSEWLLRHQVSLLSNFPNWLWRNTASHERMNSPRASFIWELQTIYLEEDGWLGGDLLDWDRSCGSDFRCVSQVIFRIEKISGNLKGVTILQLEKWLNLQVPFSSDFKAKISDAYRIFAELVQDKKTHQGIQETCQGVAGRVYDDWITGFRSWRHVEHGSAVRCDCKNEGWCES